MSRSGKDRDTRVRTAKKRTASSTRWLQRQLNDPYVKQAKAEGYRSRAAYKLIELDEKFGLLKGITRVVDLGIAPGGWSQVVRKLKPKAHVVGIDLLEVDGLEIHLVEVGRILIGVQKDRVARGRVEANARDPGLHHAGGPGRSTDHATTHRERARSTNVRRNTTGHRVESILPYLRRDLGQRQSSHQTGNADHHQQFEHAGAATAGAGSSTRHCARTPVTTANPP